FIIDLKKEELDAKLKKMWNMLAFSAVPIAASLGMTAVTPYLDQDFKDYAMSISSDYKIRKKGSLIFGKWILRKAFENILPKEIAWRTKAPIQCGSGTITLSEYYNSEISDAEFKEKKELYRKKDHVILYDKEQLAYYEIFRSVIGVPKKRWFSLAATCPQCNSELSPFLDFCHACGSTKIPLFNVPHYATK
ncbi:MAG: asparagine synthase-related protein, partial [Candidatus Methanomethylicus sp.]|nr:asparagine synthase-related protein [Candidatus Methanomethylicus sp.]